MIDPCSGKILKNDYSNLINEDEYRMNNKFLPWLALFLTLGLGWLTYRLTTSMRGSDKEIPPLIPQIIAREDWGARPLNLEASEEYGIFDADTNPEGVLYYQGNLSEILNTIVVHHSAFPNAGPVEIQDLHMDVRGFADVAYHYMIAPDGTIYEGRPINVRGAHVRGYNTGSVGIVLLGNFNEDLPTADQLVHLRLLVDYLRYSYDIRYLAGHKDYPNQSPDGTECPGDQLYPLLSDLADQLDMRYGIGGYIRPAWLQ
jgi:hypothetical protein